MGKVLFQQTLCQWKCGWMAQQPFLIFRFLLFLFVSLEGWPILVLSCGSCFWVWGWPICCFLLDSDGNSLGLDDIFLDLGPGPFVGFVWMVFLKQNVVLLGCQDLTGTCQVFSRTCQVLNGKIQEFILKLRCFNAIFFLEPRNWKCL